MALITTKEGTFATGKDSSTGESVKVADGKTSSKTSSTISASSKDKDDSGSSKSSSSSSSSSQTEYLYTVDTGDGTTQVVKSTDPALDLSKSKYEVIGTSSGSSGSNTSKIISDYQAGLNSTESGKVTDLDKGTKIIQSNMASAAIQGYGQIQDKTSYGMYYDADTGRVYQESPFAFYPHATPAIREAVAGSNMGLLGREALLTGDGILLGTGMYISEDQRLPKQAEPSSGQAVKSGLTDKEKTSLTIAQQIKQGFFPVSVTETQEGTTIGFVSKRQSQAEASPWMTQAEIEARSGKLLAADRLMSGGQPVVEKEGKYAYASDILDKSDTGIAGFYKFDIVSDLEKNVFKPIGDNPATLIMRPGQYAIGIGAEFLKFGTATIGLPVLTAADKIGGSFGISILGEKDAEAAKAAQSLYFSPFAISTPAPSLTPAPKDTIVGGFKVEIGGKQVLSDTFSGLSPQQSGYMLGKTGGFQSITSISTGAGKLATPGQAAGFQFTTAYSKISMQQPAGSLSLKTGLGLAGAGAAFSAGQDIQQGKSIDIGKAAGYGAGALVGYSAITAAGIAKPSMPKIGGNRPDTIDATFTKSTNAIVSTGSKPSGFGGSGNAPLTITGGKGSPLTLSYTAGKSSLPPVSYMWDGKPASIIKTKPQSPLKPFAPPSKPTGSVKSGKGAMQIQRTKQESFSQIQERFAKYEGLEYNNIMDKLKSYKSNEQLDIFKKYQTHKKKPVFILDENGQYLMTDEQFKTISESSQSSKSINPTTQQTIINPIQGIKLPPFLVTFPITSGKTSQTGKQILDEKDILIPKTVPPIIADWIITTQEEFISSRSSVSYTDEQPPKPENPKPPAPSSFSFSLPSIIGGTILPGFGLGGGGKRPASSTAARKQGGYVIDLYKIDRRIAGGKEIRISKERTAKTKQVKTKDLSKFNGVRNMLRAFRR